MRWLAMDMSNLSRLRLSVSLFSFDALPSMFIRSLPDTMSRFLTSIEPFLYTSSEGWRFHCLALKNTDEGRNSTPIPSPSVSLSNVPCIMSSPEFLSSVWLSKPNLTPRPLSFPCRSRWLSFNDRDAIFSSEQSISPSRASFPLSISAFIPLR